MPQLVTHSLVSAEITPSRASCGGDEISHTKEGRRMSQEMGRAGEGRRRRVEDKSVDESEDGSEDRLEDHWRVESRKEGERKESEDKAGRMSHGTSRGGDSLSLFC